MASILESTRGRSRVGESRPTCTNMWCRVGRETPISFRSSGKPKHCHSYLIKRGRSCGKAGTPTPPQGRPDAGAVSRLVRYLAWSDSTAVDQAWGLTRPCDDHWHSRCGTRRADLLPSRLALAGGFDRDRLCDLGHDRRPKCQYH